MKTVENKAHVKPKLVMIGNGMAGVRTIESLLDVAPDYYDITIIGDEPSGNYNRIMLSPVLANESVFDEIVTHGFAWYEANNIDLKAGVKVTKIDRVKSLVATDTGEDIPYDRLLIATGSRPFVLPIEGNDLPGVISYRDINDVELMKAAAKEYKNAVVIGGGLLGLEAANGLLVQGMNVTVVHLSPFILERQLDETAARLLQSYLEDAGVNFKLSAMTEKLTGKSRVEKLHLKTGEVIDADLVVMAAGVIPRTELAKTAGLPCERGILVNDCMQTFDPKVYAVGECAQHRGVAYGLVAPLYEQAEVCANHLAEKGFFSYAGTILSTKLKVTGVDLFSAGDFNPSDDGDDHDVLTFNDPARQVYKKLVIRQGRLVGAVLYGDTRDGPWYFDLIQSGNSVSAFRDHIAFGKAYCETVEQEAA